MVRVQHMTGVCRPQNIFSRIYITEKATTHSIRPIFFILKNNINLDSLEHFQKKINC